MNFTYFTPSDIQIPRVDRQCIVRFCEAMALQNVKVKLVSLKIRVLEIEESRKDVWTIYGVVNRFKLVLMPTFLHQESHRTAKLITRFVSYLAFSFLDAFSRKSTEKSVYYFKNYLLSVAFRLSRIFRPVSLIMEVHQQPKNSIQRFILAHIDGIVANTYALERDLRAIPALSKQKILGCHQGVNLERIESIRISKLRARKRLDLPLNKKLLVYTGKVYDGYGEIEYYATLAELLDDSFQVLVVGGRADHVLRIRQRYGSIANLEFRSFVPPEEVVFYQFAADALLLYYPPGINLNRYRSPGKLFDYMASGNPILAADYPVLSEILQHGQNGYLVEKDRPEKLAAAAVNLLEDPKLCSLIGEAAYESVREYTWEQRAIRIREFLNNF